MGGVLIQGCGGEVDRISGSGFGAGRRGRLHTAGTAGTDWPTEQTTKNNIPRTPKAYDAQWVPEWDGVGGIGMTTGAGARRPSAECPSRVSVT